MSRKSVIHLLAPAKFWHGRLNVNSERQLELPVIELIHQQIDRNPQEFSFGHSPLTRDVVQLCCLLIAEVDGQRRALANGHLGVTSGWLRHRASSCNYMTIHEMTWGWPIYLRDMLGVRYVTENA